MFKIFKSNKPLRYEIQLLNEQLELAKEQYNKLSEHTTNLITERLSEYNDNIAVDFNKMQAWGIERKFDSELALEVTLISHGNVHDCSEFVLRITPEKHNELVKQFNQQIRVIS